MKKLLLFIASFCLDRITKWLVLAKLSSTPLAVCSGCNLVITWNRGVSWSMFSSSNTHHFWFLFTALSVVACSLAVYIFWRIKNNLPAWWEILVFAGAISNLVDRVLYGAVLDFIELYVGRWSWPVFNVADSLIVCGVIGMLFRQWKGQE